MSNICCELKIKLTARMPDFLKDNKSDIIEKHSALWNFFLMGCVSFSSSTNSEIQVDPKRFPGGWACWTLLQNTTTNTYLAN